MIVGTGSDIYPFSPRGIRFPSCFPLHSLASLRYVRFAANPTLPYANPGFMIVDYSSAGLRRLMSVSLLTSSGERRTRTALHPRQPKSQHPKASNQYCKIDRAADSRDLVGFHLNHYTRFNGHLYEVLKVPYPESDTQLDTTSKFRSLH